MGYFPNGESGRDYQEQYCSRCVHWPPNPDDGGCTVWLLHLMNNYNECNKPDSYLHTLIPRDGIENKRCTMFHPNPFLSKDKHL